MKPPDRRWWLPLRPQVVYRIARWEATKSIGRPDRRTLAVALVALLAVGALAPAVTGQAGTFDDGIYRVGVAPDHPYADVVATDSTFRVAGTGAAALADGRLGPDEGYELVLTDRGIVLAGDGTGPTEKSRAALAELRETAERYNDRLMRAEENQSAAFPVFPVTLQYVERAQVVETIAPVADDRSGGDTGGTNDGDGQVEGSAGDGTPEGPTNADAATDRSTEGGSLGLPSLGADFLGTGTSSGAPSDIAPPFPFQSLVLAFAFVVPLNFVIQAYSSSVLGERLERRGELLLVAPVKPREIVAGKTLPYLLVAVAVGAGIAAVVGGGPLSVLAVVPLSLLFLGAAFVGAMFARSFKELTFVTVTISVSLTTFAFVPAIFADVGPVALISPLTLVVRDLAGTAVPAGDILFATLPSTLTALVLFGFGTGVYREEDMFTQRSVPLKTLDALAGRIRRPRSVAFVTALLVPFVFVAELLVVALLYALPGTVSIPVLLTTIALIEEVAKSLPALAGFTNARYGRDLRTALLVGAASGVGFFIAEKLTLVVQLVGLPESAVGSAAFQVAPGLGPFVLVALLLAPLALHVVTACISAVGAARGTNGWLLGLGVAVVVHVAYNLAVVTSLV